MNATGIKKNDAKKEQVVSARWAYGLTFVVVSFLTILNSEIDSTICFFLIMSGILEYFLCDGLDENTSFLEQNFWMVFARCCLAFVFLIACYITTGTHTNPNFIAYYVCLFSAMCLLLTIVDSSKSK